MLHSFLQLLDEDESDSLIVATSNIAFLIDPALFIRPEYLFRRFDLVIEYKLPELPAIIEILKAPLLTFDTTAVDWKVVADAAAGLGHSSLIRASEDAAREAILGRGPTLTTQNLVAAIQDERYFRGRTNADSTELATRAPSRSR